MLSSLDPPRQSEGFVLLAALFFLTAMAMLASVGLTRSMTELRAANQSVNEQQAFHLVEAGLDDALVWLRSQPAPPAGTSSICPSGGDPTIACTPTSAPMGTYAAIIIPDPNNPTSYMHLYTIASTGRSSTNAAVSSQVSMVLQAPTFARYAYFTNSERLSNGTQLWFTSSDHLRGPVHANDRFNIAGNPIFDSQVTSTASAINYKTPPPTGGNNPQFNGGLSLNVASVQLPMVSTALRMAATAGGQWYQGNTTITLLSNGTMLVTNATKGWANHLTSLPSNGAMFVNGGSASISGILHGQLTVGASADVTITSNMIYSNDPQLDSLSTDVLGLVAERNVVIAQSAPYDLTIQASVMALNTSFTVANYQVGPPKGTLNVYGGLIQARRGAVGTFSGTTGQKLSGYSKDYQYDMRFSNLAPPFFPTTGAYQQVLWQDTR